MKFANTNFSEIKWGKPLQKKHRPGVGYPTKQKGFGKPGQRSSQQIQAEIEHLRAKDTATSQRVRSTYTIKK